MRRVVPPRQDMPTSMLPSGELSGRFWSILGYTPRLSIGELLAVAKQHAGTPAGCVRYRRTSWDLR